MLTGVALAGVALAGAALVGAVGLAGLRRRWTVVTVRGESMLPALLPGERVLARRLVAGGRDLRVGDIVVASWRAPSPAVAETPAAGDRAGEQDKMIKRVAAVPGDPVPAAVRQVALDVADATPEVAAELRVALAGALAAPAVVPSGHLVVLGDNGGYDSCVFGLLPVDRVSAVVVRGLSGS